MPWSKDRDFPRQKEAGDLPRSPDRAILVEIDGIGIARTKKTVLVRSSACLPQKLGRAEQKEIGERNCSPIDEVASLVKGAIA